MKAPKLKPCPACNGKTLRVFIWNPLTRYGECLRASCRMSGPLRATDAEAAEAWNELPRKNPKPRDAASNTRRSQ